jgi:integrase
MSKQTRAITVRSIETFKGPGRLWCADNLFLALSRSGGGRHWVFRFTRPGGKVTEAGLGSFPTVTLAMAREKADALRVDLAKGIDPIAAKREARVKALIETTTFRTALDAWRGAPKNRDKPQTAVLIDRLERHAGDLMSKPLTSIDTPAIAAALRKVHSTAEVTAHRALNGIARVLDHAKVVGLRAGDNPAAWRGTFEHLWGAPPPTTHLRSVPYDAVPRVYSDLVDLDTIASHCLRFAILTAARTSNALYATFDQIDFSAMTWTIDADLMKMKRAHIVPLCDETMAIVAAMRERRPSSALVFPASHGGKQHYRSLTHLLHRVMGIEASVHGFRSSFSTWAHDETSFDHLTIEQALAHEEGRGNAVARAYDRGNRLEKRRSLMAAWAGHCTGRTATATVVPFSTRA